MEKIEPTEAINQLTNYQQQADMDGTYVTVSRQALGEVLDYLRTPPASQSDKALVIPVNEPPHPLVIAPQSRCLLILKADGTIESNINDAAEAAKVFVQSLQAEWALAVSGIKAAARREGIEEAAKAALRAVDNHWNRIEVTEAIRALKEKQP